MKDDLSYFSDDIHYLYHHLVLGSLVNVEYETLFVTENNFCLSHDTEDSSTLNFSYPAAAEATK